VATVARFLGVGCALTTGGNITCWGDNEMSNAPEGRYTAVSAGDQTSCGLRSDGGIECWGAMIFVRPAA